MPAKSLLPISVRTLTLRADSINADARSVDAVLATGDLVGAFDMNRWEVIDEILLLDGLVMPPQLPLVDTHPEARLGHALNVTTDELHGSVRSIRREGDTLVGTLVFASDAKSDIRWGKVRDGHLRDVSLGYLVTEAATVQPYRSREINGRQYKAGKRPLRIGLRSLGRELSLTVIGADSRTKIRSSAGRRGVLAAELRRLIDRRAGRRCSRPELIGRLAAVGRLPVDSIHDLTRNKFTGRLDAGQIKVFAAVLGVPTSRLMGAAIADGCLDTRNT